MFESKRETASFGPKESTAEEDESNLATRATFTGSNVHRDSEAIYLSSDEEVEAKPFIQVKTLIFEYKKSDVKTHAEI